MDSLDKLYRIGHGPSSSHTMGPRAAAESFAEKHPQAASFRVALHGSLAATGNGHLTDAAIAAALSPRRVEIVWQADAELPGHPNGMRFAALSATGETLADWTVYSVGGGELSETGTRSPENSVYAIGDMRTALAHCEQSGEALWEIVFRAEDGRMDAYLREAWRVMREAITRGLAAEGVLPGGLGVARKAGVFFRKAKMAGPYFARSAHVFAYALAASEENAAGGLVVTAPTCGSCGVLPAVLRHLAQELDAGEGEIIRALATAGLVGNFAKHNASVSGAEVGCQGEIGVACAMAAAAAAQLLGGTPRQVEYAAEMGLEHHLGLTCDPVLGLVQIPCIERNAHAAARALNCAEYALLSDGSHRIPFDEVVLTMKRTGRDLPSLYRETASGGLARSYADRKGNPA